MVEQLFTVRSEEKGNGKERREQLFTKSEKKSSEETDRNRNGREIETERVGVLKGGGYLEKSRGAISENVGIQEFS